MWIGKENKMSKVSLVLAFMIVNHNIANGDAMIDCDSCIRTNNGWCPGQGCLLSSFDGDLQCPKPLEPLIDITETPPVPGDLVHPLSSQKILPTFAPYDTELNEIYYKSPVELEDVSFDYNTHLIIITYPWIDERVNDTHRRLTIAAKVKAEFCSETTSSDVVVRVGDLGTSTQTILVKCSCQCSSASKSNASECNYQGDYSCGVCFCNNFWTGTKCDERCETRGDVQAPEYCENAHFYTGKAKECNGNGRCSCSSCVCSDIKEGSQYFSPDYRCIDVCTATLPCDKCLLNGSLGHCESCYKPEELILDFHFKIELLNMTKAKHDKVLNRNVWVHCHTVLEDCEFDYYAMKESNSQTYVAMITNNTRCTSPAAIAAGGAGKPAAGIPLIIGILLALVMLTLISVFVWWKHIRPVPAHPTSNSQYANIEAENCTGENPLYKPPTSSFKNPTYGKW